MPYPKSPNLELAMLIRVPSSPQVLQLDGTLKGRDKELAKAQRALHDSRVAEEGARAMVSNYILCFFNFCCTSKSNTLH